MDLPMTTHNPSRKDLQAFHAWTKTLPYHQVSFLYQTYMKEEERHQKTIELFQRWLKEKNQIHLTSPSGSTTPTPSTPHPQL